MDLNDGRNTFADHGQIVTGVITVFECSEPATDYAGQQDKNQAELPEVAPFA